MTMHKLMAQTMDTVIEKIKEIQKNARENNDTSRPVMADDSFAYSERLDRSEGS